MLIAFSFVLSLRVVVALLKYSSWSHKFHSIQGYQCTLKIFANRPNNKHIQSELLSVFEGRPVREEIINAFLDVYQEDMNSINILTLFNKLNFQKTFLHENRLINILQKLRDTSEELSADNIINLVRFSSGVHNSNLKNEIWTVILTKVITSIYLLFLDYLLIFYSDYTSNYSIHFETNIVNT